MELTDSTPLSVRYMYRGRAANVQTAVWYLVCRQKRPCADAAKACSESAELLSALLVSLQMVLLVGFGAVDATRRTRPV